MLNPQALSEVLRAQYLAGDRFDLKIERGGDASRARGWGTWTTAPWWSWRGERGAVGQTVEVEVANTSRTALGRMVFAELEP